MSYVFAAPGQVVLPVAGSTDLFPVRRVYCVGRNYADHAREMGHSGREAPFFFGKPADAVLPIADGAAASIDYPGRTSDLHYEAELVVAIGARGAAVPAAQAARLIWGYAVGLDLTRRDLQAQAKQQGRPWDVAKGFDHSAPVSTVKPVQATGLLEQAHLWLDHNGQRRQDGNIRDMIWNVGEIIEHLSGYFALAPGDLIFTGTPAGVGAVGPGDTLRAGVDGVARITLTIGAAAERPADGA